MDAVSIACEVVLAKPDRVFDFVTDVDVLPRVFTGCGPIPSIQAAEIVGGGEMAEGAVRRVTNSDGSVIDERITALRRGELQEYTLESGFVPPVSYMVHSGKGRWTFEPYDEGTQITWRFAFVPTSIVFWPLLTLLAKVWFHQAQMECLANIKRCVEGD